MKIPAEHEAEIRSILSRMSCPRHAECCDPEAGKPGAIHYLAEAEFIECLDPRGFGCPFALSFGYSLFCRCPLRKYLIEQELG